MVENPTHVPTIVFLLQIDNTRWTLHTSFSTIDILKNQIWNYWTSFFK
jgi:hypothetical protein